MYEVADAMVEDLPWLATLAREFYAASRFLRHFDLDRFVSLWTGLLERKEGVIILLKNGQEIVGAIGGVAYPEQYSGELIAQEFFWFVSEQHRGKGLWLYCLFEEWAKLKGCPEIRMAHLSDVMPDKVMHVYERLGFEKTETLYTKRLTG